MLNVLINLFASWGLEPTLAAVSARTSLTFLIVLLAFVADRLAAKYLIRLLVIIFKATRNSWDDIFLQEKVFDRLANLAPAIVVHLSAPLVFPDTPSVGSFIQRLAFAYMVFVTALVIDALLTSFNSIYQTFPISRDRPIKAYIQVVKIIVAVLSVIFVLATLINTSPWGLLSGLGAMTAIIMLVFKDSILGFVASIQLIANNMVRPGDWIEMSKYGADGSVVDVTIHTVKVQNWDKTITTIPTYALVNDSFKNWRGMEDSGGRRIKRSINIDTTSIKFCSDEILERFKRIELLKDYLNESLEEISTYNEENKIDTSEIVNGRRLTNIGLFREYVKRYLRVNPKINQNMTFLVRHLSPTEKGLPIQIYVFSNDQRWAHYESIQADIFDHILAIIPEFGLQVFQNPTGKDIRTLQFGD